MGHSPPLNKKKKRSFRAVSFQTVVLEGKRRKGEKMAKCEGLMKKVLNAKSRKWRSSAALADSKMQYRFGRFQADSNLQRREPPALLGSQSVLRAGVICCKEFKKKQRPGVRAIIVECVGVNSRGEKQRRESLRLRQSGPPCPSYGNRGNMSVMLGRMHNSSIGKGGRRAGRIQNSSFNNSFAKETGGRLEPPCLLLSPSTEGPNSSDGGERNRNLGIVPTLFSGSQKRLQSRPTALIHVGPARGKKGNHKLDCVPSRTRARRDRSRSRARAESEASCQY